MRDGIRPALGSGVIRERSASDLAASRRQHGAGS